MDRDCAVSGFALRSRLLPGEPRGHHDHRGRHRAGVGARVEGDHHGPAARVRCRRGNGGPGRDEERRAATATTSGPGPTTTAAGPVAGAATAFTVVAESPAAAAETDPAAA